jgi:hypothetical protein
MQDFRCWKPYVIPHWRESEHGAGRKLETPRRLENFRSVAVRKVRRLAVQVKPGRPGRWLPDISMAKPASDCGRPEDELMAV